MTSAKNPAANQGTTETKQAVLDLVRATTELERKLDRRLSSLRGISFSEYQLVRELAAAPGGAAARVDLANAVGLTPSAVTRALKPLEKLGYVATERSERDARRALATLTSAGVELLADAESALDDSFDAIDLGPSKRADLRAVLDRLGDLR